MEDGRTITTTHQFEAVLNDYLLKETDIHSNLEYRRYLMELKLLDKTD